MIRLENEQLNVSILDPVADKDRLGTRYCTAGFIFQIEDLQGTPARGILLSGPTFPDSYNLYDGQGVPDAFHPTLVLDQEPDGTPLRILGIGIGLIDAKANAVTERCKWDVAKGVDFVRFRTTQAAGPWRFNLERTLTLRGRTIRSETVLDNTGNRHVPFQWYPHPFFPLYPTGECCKLSVPITLPENPGYELLDNGFLRMRRLPWTGSENHFQLLGHSGTAPVSFIQKHPVTSLVTASCDYVPTRLPVWGNGFTFSFEPYHERTLYPGDAARWSITYDF
jgi:hypothetical protein